MTDFLSWNTTNFCLNVVFNFLHLIWIALFNIVPEFSPQSVSYESDINTLSGHLLRNFMCGLWHFPAFFLLLYVPWGTLSWLIKCNRWNLLLLQKNTNLQIFCMILHKTPKFKVMRRKFINCRNFWKPTSKFWVFTFACFTWEKYKYEINNSLGHQLLKQWNPLQYGFFLPSQAERYLVQL